MSDKNKETFDRTERERMHDRIGSYYNRTDEQYNPDTDPDNAWEDFKYQKYADDLE